MLATTYEISMDASGVSEVLAALRRPIAAVVWTPPAQSAGFRHLIEDNIVHIDFKNIRSVTEREHTMLVSALLRSSSVLYSI